MAQRGQTRKRSGWEGTAWLSAPPAEVTASCHLGPQEEKNKLVPKAAILSLEGGRKKSNISLVLHLILQDVYLNPAICHRTDSHSQGFLVGFIKSIGRIRASTSMIQKDFVV